MLDFKLTKRQKVKLALYMSLIFHRSLNYETRLTEVAEFDKLTDEEIEARYP